MDMMMDTIMIVFGAYLIYCSVVMKRTGKLTSGVMVRKDVDLSKAKDVPGFIRYMYGKTIAMGVGTCIAGAVGIVNDLYGGFGWIFLAVIVVFFVGIVAFGVVAAKAQKKYLGI